MANSFIRRAWCCLLLFGAVSSRGQQVQISRTSAVAVKGMILLLDSTGNQARVSFLCNNGFDVAQPNHNNFKKAAAIFHLLKANKNAYNRRGERLDIAGAGSGGRYAASIVQQLGPREQPDNMLLIAPAGMEETIPGTVTPEIMPPVNPSARLFAAAKTEYAKTWIGYDGRATIDTNMNSLLAAFIAAVPETQKTISNPAAQSVAGDNDQRHNEKLALVAKNKYDLIMLGNSITNNFEKPAYQPVWNQFFAPRNALNLGFSGYRTENIIWNIQHGELEGQSPKVLVLEIGTNNIDEQHYPTRHTAAQLAGGIKAIVDTLRQRMPDTKIIVLRCFPGAYGGPNPTSQRAILERASDIVSGLADNQHIFYCDVNHVFLNPDGSINHEMMPDWLHPSPVAAKKWAQAMEPLLSQLMGDTSLDTDIPENTAIVPIAKLEKDNYNWWDRHAEAMRIKDSINPEIILLGNSITHFWGGLPQQRNADGNPARPNGPVSWQEAFGKYRTLNLGFGWDRTQNLLWRLDHGELDGLHPRVVVIEIGTNNTSQTEHARENTAPEIVAGISAVIGRVRSKLPHAKIILMALFPREKDPQDPRRKLINDVNHLLGNFAGEQQITLIDIGPKMLAEDGAFLPGMMLDYTHPTEKGYRVWAGAIRSYLSK